MTQRHGPEGATYGAARGNSQQPAQPDGRPAQPLPSRPAGGRGPHERPDPRT
ncbi:hypothetical protein [Ottowia testudinis]|uniref:Uncharacterized protein n=1 Tax=Ottowia testudinis TaxID=2816950 RepID=A0A975CD21_9BURK|nr:hypothetical protein [Ottowia testudinis]QTD44035.1 hypothetical protein J1M35_12910 [Ottowia testudinis]